ncbi:MAG: AAA family ATPase, partial [Candidatus Omnitrophica bacterium]|nr:AAA family ATPase [Candidatus Omnitrophota bacterium]
KRENYLGLRLALIEELEAHLHPQAQLRVLKSLLNEKNDKVQFILTTHSTQLGSSIPLKHLKLCFDGQAFSMDSSVTALKKSDYQFLERFLDATKANLFFARGVMIVEGDAENLIIPTIAEIMDRPLHKYGVSVVNVGSNALLRYANIFKRKNGTALPIKVAVVTDLDAKVDENGNPSPNNIEEQRKEIKNKYSSNDGNIKPFISPLKTLEFDIALGNLYEYMHRAILIAKKIKSKNDWLTQYEISNIFSQLSETNPNKRASIIYEPLDKNQASKSVTAQWFAKLICDKKDKVKNLIAKDYQENKGIKYIIEAIEHVTEKIDWNGNSNN